MESMESNSFLLSGWQWKIPLRRSESSRTRSDSGLGTTSKHCQFLTCSYVRNVSMQPEPIATAFYGKEQTALGNLRLWRCGHWDSSITVLQRIEITRECNTSKTSKHLDLRKQQNRWKRRNFEYSENSFELCGQIISGAYSYVPMFLYPKNMR